MGNSTQNTTNTKAKKYFVKEEHSKLYTPICTEAESLIRLNLKNNKSKLVISNGVKYLIKNEGIYQLPISANQISNNYENMLYDDYKLLEYYILSNGLEINNKTKGKLLRADRHFMKETFEIEFYKGIDEYINSNTCMFFDEVFVKDIYSLYENPNDKKIKSEIKNFLRTMLILPKKIKEIIMKIKEKNDFTIDKKISIKKIIKIYIEALHFVYNNTLNLINDSINTEEDFIKSIQKVLSEETSLYYNINNLLTVIKNNQFEKIMEDQVNSNSNLLYIILFFHYSIYYSSHINNTETNSKPKTKSKPKRYSKVISINNSDYNNLYNDLSHNPILQIHTFSIFSSNPSYFNERIEYFVYEKRVNNKKLVLFELFIGNKYDNHNYFKSDTIFTSYIELSDDYHIFPFDDEVVFSLFTCFKVIDIINDYYDKENNMRYDTKVSLLLIEEAFPNYSSYLIESYNLKSTTISNIINNSTRKKNQLKENPSYMSILSLSHNINDYKIELESTIMSISNLYNLENLLLSNNQLSKNILQSLFKNLKYIPFLKVLKLNGNDLSDEDLPDLLSENIVFLKNLKEIDLSSCNINDASLIVISKKAIPKLGFLSKIDLENNQIEKGIVSFADGISQLEYIEYINISKNIIYLDSLEYFFQTIIHNHIKNIRYLYIADIINNSYDIDGKTNFKLVSYLKQISLLVELDISNNKILNKSIKNEYYSILFDTLSSLSLLRLLNISYNDISIFSFIDFCNNCLSKLSNLEVLIFNGILIENKNDFDEIILQLDFLVACLDNNINDFKKLFLSKNDFIDIVNTNLSQYFSIEDYFSEKILSFHVVFVDLDDESVPVSGYI